MEISWKTVYNHMAKQRTFLKSAPLGIPPFSCRGIGIGQQHTAATTTTNDNFEVELTDTIFEDIESV